MAFTDLHEIEEMFAGLSVFDISSTGWMAKLSVAEMNLARMEHQRSPKGAEQHRQAQARYRERNVEKLSEYSKRRYEAKRALLPPKPPKPPKPLCCEPGCNRPKSSKGRCQTHYHAWRKVNDPAYKEAMLTYWRDRAKRLSGSPEYVALRRRQKAAYRAKAKADPVKAERIRQQKNASARARRSRHQ